MSERKVLVVDDDPAMREVFERILATENVTVYTAVDGKDALQKTLSLKPDLILLDVNMPNLNGLTFCKAIRAGTGHPEYSDHHHHGPYVPGTPRGMHGGGS